MTLGASLSHSIARARGLLRRVLKPVTWQGVYVRPEDVPARGGHEREQWIHATRERTEAELQHPGPPGDALPLVMLVATILGTVTRVRVLDFGGGMGTAYIALRATLGPAAPLAHTVVELPPVAEVGRSLFHGDPAIDFASELPPGPFDVVHACGVLHYVEEPFNLLRRLLSYRAPYVLVTKIPAGANPTYVTAQLNVPGSVIPCWMFHLADLESTIRDAGYVIRSHIPSDVSLLGTYRTRRIPRSHRPERTVALLLTPA